MNALSYKIKETFDVIQRNGIEGSKGAISSLYSYILCNSNELEEIGLFQVTGSIFAEIAYAKMREFSRIPHMAYYCFTRGVSAIEPVGNLPLIMDNMFKSREGRLKLMFRGGEKIIRDNIHVIKNMTPQEAYEFAHMCDYLTLKQQGYSNPDRWWQLATEDVGNARKKYLKYSDSEIITIGSDINNTIAEQVLKDLHRYAIDYGYI